MRLAMLLSLMIMTTSAWAQLYESSSQDITETEAQELFKDLKNENAKMSKYSECFERAHMWALRAERVHNITMEKVYLFFTYKFNMKHRVTSRWGRAFTWWFHVAPAVRVNGELYVMDATFTDKAMPLQEWAGSLMRESETCQPLNDPMEYVSDRNSTGGYSNVAAAKNQCYYTTAPRFFYQPVEIGFREGRNGMEFVNPLPTPADWLNNTLNWALGSYDGKKNQKAARQALGF